MALGATVLDAVVGVEVGIDAVAGVTTQGLINLLVGVTVVEANWSAMLILGCLRSRVDSDIAPGSPLDVLAISLIAAKFGAMVMTSPILERATGAATA